MARCSAREATAVDDSDEEPDEKPFDLLAAVRRNRERLEQRFASARERGQRWLAECRDLGDAFDEAAGVYFVECPDDAALERVVVRCAEDNPYDRLLGIFDLSRPLEAQGGGLTRAQWLSGKRPPRASRGEDEQGGGR
jgi:hypothetical protein